MNINDAKEQIKQAVHIYLKKDKYGNYRIPLQRQRPIFLIGAPGIGKTAVVEQIAKELDIGLVSYSMTHHTRQSALGLPFITTKQYKGKSFDISEYTMSEIIASVYEVMEQSGKEEGILFLDEINCISETLAPSMLQFLQYKTFGRHRVPDGWVIVTAGNPQEFNRSVREFDVVTLDRLKVLNVEPSYRAWRDYATNRGVHKAILTYLDVKKEDFYLIETTVDGRSYVTARGWEDLSDAMYLNEECGYAVDEVLIGQFLRNKRIVRDFAAYYDLYRKYRQDYSIRDILNGSVDKQIRNRAKKAPFDERLSLMGLLLEAVQHGIKEQVETDDALRTLLPVLKEVKASLTEKPLPHILADMVSRTKNTMEKQKAANALSKEEKNNCQYMILALEQDMHELRRRNIDDASQGFTYIKEEFEERVAQLREHQKSISEQLHHLFDFVDKTFGDGNEMLILVTELTVNDNCAKFISRNGCKDYFKHNKKFMLHERNEQLLRELQRLEARQP